MCDHSSLKPDIDECNNNKRCWFVYLRLCDTLTMWSVVHMCESCCSVAAVVTLPAKLNGLSDFYLYSTIIEKTSQSKVEQWKKVTQI